MFSYYDIIIIGSGMAGLYAALSVKKLCPDKNIIIVGEVISIHQGWVEGALESVNITLTKDWLKC